MRFSTFLFIFLIGFGLLLISSFYIIAYLNLLTIGYSFLEYVKYIIVRPECLVGIIGISMILISTFIYGGNKNELCL